MWASLHIDRLPLDFTDEELRLLVQNYGTVLAAKMSVSPEDSGQGRGYIQMLTSREVAAAKVHLHRTLVGGHEILVFMMTRSLKSGLRGLSAQCQRGRSLSLTHEASESA